MPRLTSRLTLDNVSIRPLVRTDGEAVFNYLSSDSTISQWTRIPWPYTRAHLEGFLARIDQFRTVGADVVAAVTVGGDDRLVGCCGLHRIDADWQPRSSFIPNELGYWLGAEQRGTGVMRRAASLLVQYALTELELEVVNAQTNVDNVASQNVLRRIGFRFTEKVFASQVSDDNHDHDRFSITAADWEAAHGPLVAPMPFEL